MGKKKANSKRKSELRIIFFIILVAAALFIISTYAWFSTQRNVSINNLTGKVEVAEGLEISLNGKTWSNELVLGDKEGQFNITDSTTDFGPYPGHRNISPVEMLPVSTLGIPSTAEETDLKMIRGKVTNLIELSEIVVMDETLALSLDPEEHNAELAKYPGYFAFDIFLKNSSKQNKIDDPLQLNYDSSLKIVEDGNDIVGLQNTVRVALAKFGGEEGPDGRTGVADVMADQATVLQKTGAGGESPDDVYITDVAMWEPNSNDHVEYIVTNNNSIKWPSGSTFYGKTFTVNTQMPTYALTENAIDNTMKDLYDWDGSTVDRTGKAHDASKPMVKEQIALQTTKTGLDEKTGIVDYSIKEGVQQLFSTTDKESQFSIAPNCIIRLRVYVWLEGQDVDCINYASHGGGVTLNLGLVKGSEIGSHEPVVE